LASVDNRRSKRFNALRLLLLLLLLLLLRPLRERDGFV
jgi:hypothetical protein